jgi:hypothetical protein
MRCAKNINELIPYLYDTKRTITVIGQDDKTTVMTINDPSEPNSDITAGKYGITVDVGPTSETKRTLAQEQMMAFVNAMPQAASMVMDLVAEAQDWPKSGQFAERFKMALPAGVVPEDELTPEMKSRCSNSAAKSRRFRISLRKSRTQRSGNFRQIGQGVER